MIDEFAVVLDRVDVAKAETARDHRARPAGLGPSLPGGHFVGATGWSDMAIVAR